MNKTIKKQWVDELRSGKFKQTRDYLHVVKSSDPETPVGFCCLGVLACLAPNEMLGVPGEPAVQDLGFATIETIVGDLNGSLTAEILYWAGIDTAIMRVLMEMNDGVGAYSGKPRSFAEIADWIEENL